MNLGENEHKLYEMLRDIRDNSNLTLLVYGVEDDYKGVNFEPIKTDLAIAISLCASISEIPSQYIGDEANGIFQAVDRFYVSWQQLRTFRIESPASVVDSSQRVAELQGAVRSATLELISATRIISNITLALRTDALTSTSNRLIELEKSQVKLISEMDAEAKVCVQELNEIVSRARRSEADFAVSSFSAQFRSQSKRHSLEADRWLAGVVVLAVITLLAAVVSYLFVDLEAVHSRYAIIHLISSKVMAVGVLVWGVMWSGKMFAASKHQATINAHKANALGSFQTFVRVSKDEQSREAVLLQTTNAIFSIPSSGYIDTKDNNLDAATKLAEAVKSLASASK